MYSNGVFLEYKILESHDKQLIKIGIKSPSFNSRINNWAIIWYLQLISSLQWGYTNREEDYKLKITDHFLGLFNA
jgi:hypothetical protein